MNKKTTLKLNKEFRRLYFKGSSAVHPLIVTYACKNRLGRNRIGITATKKIGTGRKVVGIDLGTTFSAIAHIDGYGKPQILPNAESERITPSVILFDGSNAVVGTYAKQNSVAEPEKIVDFVKREMGKSKDEFHREFADKNFSAEELSALILK